MLYCWRAFQALSILPNIMSTGVLPPAASGLPPPPTSWSGSLIGVPPACWVLLRGGCWSVAPPFMTCRMSPILIPPCRAEAVVRDFVSSFENTANDHPPWCRPATSVLDPKRPPLAHQHPRDARRACIARMLVNELSRSVKAQRLYWSWRVWRYGGEEVTQRWLWIWRLGEGECWGTRRWIWVVWQRGGGKVLLISSSEFGDAADILKARVERKGIRRSEDRQTDTTSKLNADGLVNNDCRKLLRRENGNVYI